jgi:hypothetical protein
VVHLVVTCRSKRKHIQHMHVLQASQADSARHTRALAATV